MKKMLFGASSAALAAFGLASFKSSRFTRQYYWFELSSNKVRFAPLPALRNSDLNMLIGVYAVTYGTAPPPNPCSGGDFYCMVGFGSSQMSSLLEGINTVNGPISAAAGGAYSRDY